jgi:tetratricopeptide (TPR) repeat protein
MVAGDVVNTASRIQSVAEPGTVLVGEATRRASEQAIVYEQAGSFELKGKEGETQLWKARRVVSGVGGDLKSQGLEAPFVGRDRELRQIKDLFHICADEQRAQLVSVTGIAGIGKSRLAWEFYKYFDGLALLVYWHRGRCLAYGEGVTYWALADMVRMRCQIAEEEEQESALGKLHAALEEHILDADEREFLEPRLAQLLGLGGHEARERQDLFAAWRLFFERLAETYPTVLVFEDMQWADESLLDFVEHLLEWSRNHALFVVTLARPELVERRPTWGAGHRNFTSLYLEPLAEAAMEELLAGLVPGLPAQLREKILARAEGVPLYAMETVRMLLDRGLLVEDGASYRVVGEIESLEVPETLHALVAARLDGLDPEERRLLGDASVLGKTFSPASLSAVMGVETAELAPRLGSLVRKEVLGLQADQRSPEHGQYGFLQDLLRQVAYETLPKRERRAKHLLAAEQLAGALSEEEVAEVVASHLVEAYRLDPDAPDAAELRSRASAALLRAGERAASLGASTEAGRYFEQAGELADDSKAHADAINRAGDMAIKAGDARHGAALFERAIGLYEATGERREAAAASSSLAYTEQITGHGETAVERMERAYDLVADDEPDRHVALLLFRLAQGHFFLGNLETSHGWLEQALDVAEALHLSELMVLGWTLRAGHLVDRRPEECRGLLELAARLAVEEAPARVVSTHTSLADLDFHRDRYSSSVGYLEGALDGSRRLGDRRMEWFVLCELTYALYMLGRWDESLARMAEIPEEQLGAVSQLLSPLNGVLEIHLHRGEPEQGRALLARFGELGREADVQTEGGVAAATAALQVAAGEFLDGLASGEQALSGRETIGIGAQDVKQGYLHALEAAFALGDREKVEELCSIVENEPVGLQPPLLAAFARRFRARLAGEDPSADGHFVAAAARLRALELPFHLAVALLEHGEWLAARGRADDAEPLLAEARDTFERLGATPWLGRLDAVDTGEPAGIPA